MVRISDIFKRQPPKIPEAPEAKHKAEPAEDKPAEEIKQETHAYKPEVRPAHEAFVQKGAGDAISMRIDKVMKETPSDKARSNNLYLMGIQLITEALANADQLKPINLLQIKQWVSDIANCLISTDMELLRLFYEYTSENYLYSHMVNTSILSIEVGIGLGYNKSQLDELGLAGFLHDIGMIKVGKLDMQTRKLTEAEYNEIKNHPVYGTDILTKIKDITDAIVYAVKEEHERMNGTGYPRGLKDGEISEYARIIGIVDAYEALIHNRPYRKKSSFYDAIKEIVASHLLFDSEILKVLINRVGVYPVSSWMQLNSNEIGKVLISNNEFPLRPIVHILYDSTGEKLKVPRTVNLAQQFNLFIKKSLSYEDLANRK